MASSLFRLLAEEAKLNPRFKGVAAQKGHMPAREALQAAFDRLPKPDGNFVLDFQTTGFDARVWELYLAVFARSEGLDLAQPFDRPDYLLSRGEARIWVEAVTVNPTQGQPENPLNASAANHWQEQEAAGIKLGSALWSKLGKEYWKLEHVKGMPLVLAIADFQSPDPFRRPSSALAGYLYGSHTDVEESPGDRVEYALRPVGDLRSGQKVIPAGFFKQPGAENISAVLFSNAGTIAKFDRMGYSKDRHGHIRMVRYGYRFNRGKDMFLPKPFFYIVGEFEESWGQEVVVFHNPRALRTVPRGFFGAVTEYWQDETDVSARFVDFLPLWSQTNNYSPWDGSMDAALRGRFEAMMRELEQREPEIRAGLIEFHKKWPERYGEVS